MSWRDRLRSAGSGVIERPGSEEYVIGHPHPLYDAMCDVIDAAAKAQWNWHRGNRMYSSMRRLRDKLDALEQELNRGDANTERDRP